jgi:hypothetical protein
MPEAMSTAILIETCILGVLLLFIFAVMVSKEKVMASRSWYLGVLIVSVLLYVIAVSLTTIINTRFGY